MSRWLLRRSIEALLALVIATALAFVVMRAAPGDPLSRLGDDHPMGAAETAALRARYGLDQPLARQFTAFASGALRGDLGTSIQHGRPVRSLLGERLGASLLLGGTVLFLNFTVGLWLGVWQAVRRGRAADHLLTGLSLTGYAMPSFWLGLVLAWYFGIRLHLLPVAGMSDPLLAEASSWSRAADVARHLVLPSLTLALVSIAATMRFQRDAMLDALRRPFVRTARAKGLSERRVIWRHAWRNALFPVITLFRLWLPILVTGSVFIESVFAWPGLGSLAAGAASARDYPLLMGTTLLAALLVVGGGLLADIAYATLDPRVSHS